MNAALTFDFPYVQQDEVKIINFTSNMVGVIKNIPSTILYIIILPLYLIIFLPFANIVLWRLYKKLLKEFGELKQDISGLPYKGAKEGYTMLSEMIGLMDSLVNSMAHDSNNFFLKGIYNKSLKINGVFKEMQDSIAAVLYVKADATPLTEKEKEAFNVMNDIWGDDSDQVYARHTHHHLTKRLKEYGV